MDEIKNATDLQTFLIKKLKELNLVSFCWFLDPTDGSERTAYQSFFTPTKLYLAKQLEIEAEKQITNTISASVRPINKEDLK